MPVFFAVCMSLNACKTYDITRFAIFADSADFDPDSHHQCCKMSFCPGALCLRLTDSQAALTRNMAYTVSHY